MRISRLRPSIFTTAVAAAAAIAVLGSSCKKDEGAMVTIPDAFDPLPALDNRQTEEIGTFARNFAAMIRESKVDEALAYFDNEKLLNRASAGARLSAESLANFREGALAGMVNDTGGALGAILGGNFAFLRILERDGEPQLLFRLAAPQGIDYYRFRFDFGADGESPRLYDFYNYTTGEYTSSSMRRAILPLILEMGGNIGDRESLTESDRALLDHMEEIQQITKHLEGDEKYLAMKKLQSLPKVLRNERFARGIELRILSDTAEREKDYVAAMERMQADFPDDPSLMMVMLDYYILKKDSAKILELLNEVETEVGLDPYHEVLRGIVYLGDGDYEKAQKSAWSAISADRTNGEAWWIALEAGLKNKNHGAVASALTTLHTEFKMEVGETALNSPAYADFFSSPEGKAFKAILQGEDPSGEFKKLGIE